jgi:1-acyl-sn-glycerol-3-phosphate acyltransferase
MDAESVLPPGVARAASRQAVGSPVAYRVGYLIVCTILRSLFRFQVEGRAELPTGGAYIAVANHLNWLDAFALLIALPRDPCVHFIGWDGVLRARKLAWLIRTSKAGFIPVPRDPSMRHERRRELRDALCQKLSEGCVLALFPEGSVGGVEGWLGMLTPGFAGLALATGAQVVPVALSGTRTLWLRKTIRVVIGLPVSPHGMDRDALVERTKAALIDLVPAYHEPGGLKLFSRQLTRLIPSLTNWTSSDL